MSRIPRRTVLRGMLCGAAVGVSLPLLDCFLDSNGQALAATGQRLPVRFGTWAWGLGMDEAIFVPKKVGKDYDLPEEIASLTDVKQHLRVSWRLPVTPVHYEFTKYSDLVMPRTSFEREPGVPQASAEFVMMAPRGDVAMAVANGHVYAVTVPQTGAEAPLVMVSAPDSSSEICSMRCRAPGRMRTLTRAWREKPRARGSISAV